MVERLRALVERATERREEGSTVEGMARLEREYPSYDTAAPLLWRRIAELGGEVVKLAGSVGYDEKLRG